MKRSLQVVSGLALAAMTLVGCGKGGSPQAQQTTGMVAEVRVKAVAEITSPEALAWIVREDKDGAVRLAALDKLTDEKLLAGLVLDGADMEARQRAMAKIKDSLLLADLDVWVNTNAAQAVSDPDLLTRLATRAWLAPIRAVAVAKASSPAVLVQVALNDPAGSVRKAAVLKLSDPGILAGIATNDPAWYVRQVAVDKITDSSVLAAIARSDTDALVGRSALAKLDSDAALLDAALHNGIPEIRQRAVEGLTTQDALATFVRETRDAQLQEFAYKRVSDPAARSSAAPWVELEAAGKVVDQALLRQLAERALAQNIRKAAVLKLVDPFFLLGIINKTNESADVRVTAVEALADEKELVALAANRDLPQAIRLAAIGKSGDQAALAEIARSEEDWSVRNALSRRITNDTIKADIQPWISQEATQKATDSGLLAKIALEAKVWDVREAAVAKLSDQNLRMAIARDTNGPATVRREAVAGLADPSALASFAGDTNVPSVVRVAAIEKVEDQALLTRIAQDAGSDDSIRFAALGRLTDRAPTARLASDTNNSSWLRLAAIKQTDDQNALVRIAVTDKDQQVRNAAEGRITNESLRVRVRPWTSSFAVAGVTNPAQLIRIAREAKPPDVRKAAVERVSDPTVLADVALKDTDKDVRKTAVQRVTDPVVLASIAKDDADADNRRLAVEQVSDPAILEGIALNDGSSNVQAIAIGRVTNASVLAKIARYDSDSAVRQAALARLTDEKLRKEVTRWTQAAAVEDVQDPVLLARMAYSAGDTNVCRAAINQLIRSTNQAPQVAYEWLSGMLQKDGKQDDAVLAMLMATVAYLQDSSKNSTLSLATFERANELRNRSEIRTAWSSLMPEGESGAAISLADFAVAVNEAAQVAFQCQDAQLVSDISEVFHDILDEGKGASSAGFSISLGGKSTNAVRYVAGDIPLVAALGLSMLQRLEDWPGIERYLASDAYHPRFAGYLRAMAAQSGAFERELFAHPSAMIRAFSCVALSKPAPDGETDMLVRCAGAWNPGPGGTNEALRLLESALNDERHVVRVMAMRGLARLGGQVPVEQIKDAITTSDEWRKKYSVGCIVWFITSALDPSLAGQQFTCPGDAPSEVAVDCSLLLAGYGLIGSQKALSDEVFGWLLQQLKLKLEEGYPMFYLSSGADAGGYRIETAQPLTVDRMNEELAAVLRQHAPAHSGQMLAALREADPYGRLILLQTTAHIATNAAVRELLWRLAETGETAEEQKTYRDRLYAEKIEEVQKSLMWNQSINYSAVREYADTVAESIWAQNRRMAVNQLSATLEDQAEFDRICALFEDRQVARSVLLLLLDKGGDQLSSRVPESRLQHKEAEVRMCAAIARLIAVDSPDARTVLTEALTGDEDRAAFAARLTLRAKTPALAEAVRSAKDVKPVSVAGFLLRQLMFDVQ